jgi:hypothetical protein
MKKHLLASTALVVGVGFAAPAAADITVTGVVEYDKRVIITETLTKVKTVTLTIAVVRTANTAAQANAVENQRIGNGPILSTTEPTVITGFTTDEGNAALYSGAGVLCAVCVGQPGRPIADFSAEVIGSINDNTGVTQFNQDVGHQSNQKNLLSAALGRQAAFAEANNASAQYNIGNRIGESGRLIPQTEGPPRVAVVRQSLLVGSVNANVGLTQVNQNSGIFNNQLNSVALAIGFTDQVGVALAETDLGQWNTNQRTHEVRTARVAGMSDAVSDNTGIVMGNQAAGHMANQANKVAISASVAFPAGAAGTARFLGSLPPSVF